MLKVSLSVEVTAEAVLVALLALLRFCG